MDGFLEAQIQIMKTRFEQALADANALKGAIEAYEATLEFYKASNAPKD